MELIFYLIRIFKNIHNTCIYGYIFDSALGYKIVIVHINFSNWISQVLCFCVNIIEEYMKHRRVLNNVNENIIAYHHRRI